ncbi:polyprenol reductase-like [Anopheles merus]|uniref:polyprenol reductase-like n=1 Tax=Anopheles merus TaxID=30066 RepID=UPI001BE3EFF1|nr:polyprenol reductase-like [Anopheles merus]
MAVCLHFVAVIIWFPWFDIRSSFLFVNLIVAIVVLGGLLATIEKHLPTAIRQTFRYDKHALKGSSDRLVSLLEILKPARDYVIAFLDTLATNKRMVRTTPTETMVAMTLITLQCLRRFYETWFVQVFSSKLKITHQWYVENIHNYLKQRKALVPFVL